MASERGMQVKSFTQGDNRVGAEAAEFPILCETCLGETPYVRMQKIPHGGTCKMCERPFTLFKWRPGRGDGYKMTNVCQTCSKVKNLCQTCILDLQFGLPSQLRDAVLSRADDESIAAPESDANREYHQQQSLVALSSGVGPWQTGETPNDKLLRIARASATNREPARVQIPSKRPASDMIETDSGNQKVIDDAVEKLFESCVAFIPVENFLGSRTHYTFKLGDDGLGYYRDKDDGAKKTEGQKKTKFVPKPPSGPPPASAFEKK